jgi:hypothetical protein
MQAIAVGDAVRSALTNASLVSPSSVDSSTDDEVPSTFDEIDDDDSAIPSASDEATAGAGATVAVAASGEVQDDGRALQAVLERTEEEALAMERRMVEASLGIGATAEEAMPITVVGSTASVSPLADELTTSDADGLSAEEEEVIEVERAGPGIDVALEVGMAALASMLMLEEAATTAVCWIVLAEPIPDPIEAIGVAIGPSAREELPAEAKLLLEEIDVATAAESPTVEVARPATEVMTSAAKSRYLVLIASGSETDAFQ